MKLTKSLIILAALALGVMTFTAAKVMAITHPVTVAGGSCQSPVNGVCPS